MLDHTLLTTQVSENNAPVCFNRNQEKKLSNKNILIN